MKKKSSSTGTRSSKTTKASLGRKGSAPAKRGGAKKLVSSKRKPAEAPKKAEAPRKVIAPKKAVERRGSPAAVKSVVPLVIAPAPQTGSARQAEASLLVSSTPQRAPVRKVIRDGKAVPVETSSPRNVEGLVEELTLALDRFRNVMALGPTRQREFADFWPAELGEIPGFLAVSCGLVEGLTAQEIVGELRGDHAGLRGVIESLHRAATAAVEVPSEVEQKKALRAPRVCDPTWSASRAHYPLHMRAFLGLVEWQSKLAAAWPFAFARFMSKIPQQMGSDEFAALVTGIDRSSEEVGATFGWEAAETSAILAQGQGRLASLFETECPDLHRQWNIALRGSGVDVNQLVQRYVVDSLNREFQMLLGRILARAMSSEGIGTEQASIRWQVGGAVAEAPETV